MPAVARSPVEAPRLVAIVMVVSLGVIAWGYVDGWFAPRPEDPRIQVSTPGARTPDVRVTSRKGEKPPPPPAAKPAGKSLVPPARPYQPQGTLTLAQATPEAAPEPAEDEDPGEAEPEEEPRKVGIRRWFESPPPLIAPQRPGARSGAGRSAPWGTSSGWGASSASAGGRDRPPAKPLVYAATARKHWVDDVDREGRTVSLEDGSVWEVADLHRFIAARFDAAADLTVSMGGQGDYGYRLALANGRASVNARLLKPPSGRNKGLKGDEELMDVQQ